MIRHPITSLIVVIPARDEELLLPRCLGALAVAVDELTAGHPHIAVRSVVVADSTTDGTHEIVARFSAVELVAVDHGNVGAARKSGIAHLLASVHEPQSAWIATTDADSVVPHDWLTGMVELGDAGADLVVGSVVPERDGLSPEQIEAWTEFRAHPDPTGDVHGANLGIRGSAYLALGGFRRMAVGEDVDLVTRAIAAGYHAVTPTKLQVVTSSRTDGRAPNGYSSWLHRGGLMPALRSATRQRSTMG